MADASGNGRSSPARSRSGSDDQDGSRDRRYRGLLLSAGRYSSPRSGGRSCQRWCQGRFAAASTSGSASVDGSPPRRCGARNCAAHTIAPDRRRSVVYLDPAPRAAFDTRDEPHARMDQRNETFVPHVLAIVAGHDGRFSEQRQDLPQRLLALEGEVVRPRPVCRRPVQAGPLRRTRHRPRVLRDPFAHERVHPRVRAPLLRGDRQRGTLSARQRAARHLHGQGLERDRSMATRPGDRSRCPKEAATSTPTSWSDERALLSHQPHLLRNGVSGRSLHRRRDRHRQRRRHAAGGRRAAARARRGGRVGRRLPIDPLRAFRRTKRA